MKITITERDKGLLRLVLSAAVLLVSAQYLILPALSTRGELETEKENVSLQKQEYEQRIALLDTIDQTIADNRKTLKAASKPYYDRRLETREMDDILSDLELKSGLFPESLSMVEAAPGSLRAYLAPEETEEQTAATDAKAELDAQDGGTDAAQPSAGASPSEPRYVYIGTATLRARGSVEQWESFLDRLQAQYSGLRIVSFDIAEATYLSADLTQVSDNSITCDLEFYMCAEQEAGA